MFLNSRAPILLCLFKPPTLQMHVYVHTADATQFLTNSVAQFLWHLALHQNTALCQ